MQIAFAASECTPFAKTGGLADVVGALPRELVRLGHHVSVYLPFIPERAPAHRRRAASTRFAR